MSTSKIMIVEDCPIHMQMISNILESERYDLVKATDGEEALKLALMEPPDLVVLDVILPKRNGFQICRHLKTTPETLHTKVILLTSKNQESDRFWGFKQGADDYITKPFEPAHLLASIRQLLKKD